MSGSPQAPSVFALARSMKEITALDPRLSTDIFGGSHPGTDHTVFDLAKREPVEGRNVARLEVLPASTTPFPSLSDMTPPPREPSPETPLTPLPSPRVAGRSKSTATRTPNSDLTGTAIVEMPENVSAQLETLIRHMMKESAYTRERFDQISRQMNEESAHTRERFDRMDGTLQMLITGQNQLHERVAKLEESLLDKLVNLLFRK